MLVTLPFTGKRQKKRMVLQFTLSHEFTIMKRNVMLGSHSRYVYRIYENLHGVGENVAVKI